MKDGVWSRVWVECDGLGPNGSIRRKEDENENWKSWIGHRSPKGPVVFKRKGKSSRKRRDKGSVWQDWHFLQRLVGKEVHVVSHRVLLAFLGQWDKQAWVECVDGWCIWYEYASFRSGQHFFSQLFRDGIAIVSRGFFHSCTEGMEWLVPGWEALKLCLFFLLSLLEFFLLHWNGLF